MLIKHPGVLARIIGVGICLWTTLVVGYLSVVILCNSLHTSWSFSASAFAIVGLIAWSSTSFGEWWWSFEEGWFGLQRSFRLIQASLIGGGLVCDITFRILHSCRVL